MGTLTVIIWGLLTEEIYKEIGVIYTGLICVIGAFVISIVISMFRKEWQEQVKLVNTFNIYSGYDRLKELLLYRILKSNK